nr:MAG TPA: hypothetical protein [Bacteriophage sp.]
MLNLFKKQENKEVYHAPYRPSWEESARAWQESHIAHKKLAERVKKELGTNILPRI